ncbi:MAG: hypothetical protein A3I61_07500 [Acidobacteria bacterium RIFCSPLOWO2_02_FULL_68_18]|nr:MAG: hypothetical protein A3I61_07500 [Acidobacteria bacterium RIFCSPLOWO2_02_FULL_68_18]
MNVSVVVPAFNEERGLAASLRAIRAGMTTLEDRGWWSELIVCDNNSTDCTAAVAREHGAAVVFEPINQISRARNAGAGRARGDWLVFVDADSHPSRALFAEMAGVIEEGRCLAGGSTVRLDQSDPLSSLVVAGWNAVSRIMHWAAGSFIFCEAHVFRELGGFSLELYAAEEIELFRRLKRVALQRRRTIAILHRHPLETSARKARLYTAREAFGFLLKTVVLGGRPLQNPADCYQWYDGRR